MWRQGVTRRSFLKYCSLAATSLGLGAGMAPKIAWVLENKAPHSGGMDPRVWNAPVNRYPLSAPLTHWRRTSSFP
ncbi:twin-arginine translocation signal domain-containing protein [Escherichia coli]